MIEKAGLVGMPSAISGTKPGHHRGIVGRLGSRHAFDGAIAEFFRMLGHPLFNVVGDKGRHGSDDARQQAQEIADERAARRSFKSVFKILAARHHLAELSFIDLDNPLLKGLEDLPDAEQADADPDEIEPSHHLGAAEVQSGCSREFVDTDGGQEHPHEDGGQRLEQRSCRKAHERGETEQDEAEVLDRGEQDRESCQERGDERDHDGPNVPAMNDPTAEIQRAWPARPWRVIWKPSMQVATEEASPGMLSRMLVVEPP